MSFEDTRKLEKAGKLIKTLNASMRDKSMALVEYQGWPTLRVASGSIVTSAHLDYCTDIEDRKREIERCRNNPELIEDSVIDQLLFSLCEGAYTFRVSRFSVHTRAASDVARYRQV